jgi:hypothetical protein
MTPPVGAAPIEPNSAIRARSLSTDTSRSAAASRSTIPGLPPPVTSAEIA